MKKNKEMCGSVPFFVVWNIMAGIMLLLSLQSVCIAHAKETDTEGAAYTASQGIVYELLDDNNCYVADCAGTIGDTAVIPARIHDAGSVYQVKGIKETAFRECKNLKKIEIPNSVTDISEGTFSGCPKLTEICIIPVRASTKKNGKTMAVTLRINGVLLGEAKNVQLKCDESLLEQAVADKGSDTISLRISIKDQRGDAGNDFTSGNIVLAKKAVRMAADSGKNLKIRITDAQGGKRYIMADAKNMKQVSGELKLLLEEHKVGSATGTLFTDLKKALKKNNIQSGNVKILSFSFGNGEKTELDVAVPIEDMAGMSAGSKAYVYRYDKNERVFTSIFYHPYVVPKEGNIKISMSKGGIFVISKKPFSYMSSKLKSAFLTEAGGAYYLDKNGKAVCGWRKIGGEYYYFDRETGKMADGGSVDGIKMKSSGVAEKTDANVRKIQTMIKAHAVVEQVTNKSDSKSQKIEKCFRWIFQFPYRRYRRLQPIYRQPGWEVTFANDIFDKHQGCCVSEASAAAFLFHECGYKTVYVACDTGHAWVELNGRVYDPLFAEARGFSQFYNVSYNGYGMRPVLKRKI